MVFLYLVHGQAEGEVMSRKSGELEGALRKVRSQARKLESDKEHLAGRLASLEASLAGEQERSMHATQAAAMQVLVTAVLSCALRIYTLCPALIVSGLLIKY